MHDQHNSTFCLNNDYSTTRLVTREKPVIESKSGDAFETVLFLPESENRTGQGGLRTQGLFKRSLPDKPLITVITVVLNGAKHLEETILSVLNQTYDNVEYIVIDGGSTDGTLGIIRKYEHAIDYWVSEKDEGIYDAMNKGIRLSYGFFIGILNSDDTYYIYIIQDIAKTCKIYPKIDYVYGYINLKNKNGIIFGYRKTLQSNEIYEKRYKENPLSHQSCFISLDVYKKIHFYNTLYKYCADYDFNIRMINCNYNGMNIKKQFGEYRVFGKSNTVFSFYDNYKIYKKNKLPLLIIYRIITLSIFKYYLKFIIPNKIIKYIKKYFKDTSYIYK
ncbi:glycosyltransferase family 2 protein [Desulfonatronum thiodismutans]|uniref:glycosyltransferase family 2 protein n=1 Tax=Desulfonatronum thiodismutans TaxID=159290 RepID=UPI00068DF412|nr:glycosyltransferase family 2 protein [Desulfonatronum thiodismutans]